MCGSNWTAKYFPDWAADSTAYWGPNMLTERAAYIPSERSTFSQPFRTAYHTANIPTVGSAVWSSDGAAFIGTEWSTNWGADSCAFCSAEL